MLPALPAETTYMEIVDAPLEIIVGKCKLGGEKFRLLIDARQHQLVSFRFSGRKLLTGMAVRGGSVILLYMILISPETSSKSSSS